MGEFSFKHYLMKLYRYVVKHFNEEEEHMESIGYAHRFGLSLDQLLAPEEPLSPNELQQVAARYFSNPWQIILVGDAKQIFGQLNHWFPDFEVVRIPAKKAMEFKP